MRSLLLFAMLAAWSVAQAQGGSQFEWRLQPPAGHELPFVSGDVSDDGRVVRVEGAAGNLGPEYVIDVYDAEGAPLWAHAMAITQPGIMLRPHRVHFMPDGGIAVFGEVSTMTEANYFVQRFGPAGALLWSHMYHLDGETSPDYGFSTARPSPDGGLILSLGLIARTVVVRLQPDGSVVWANRYTTTAAPTDKNPGFDIAATHDEGALITEKAEDDMYLVRIAGDGTVQWSYRYPNGQYTHTKSAMATSDGGFVLTGLVGDDPFAMRIDGYGTPLWWKSYQLDEGAIEYLERAVELSDLSGYLLGANGVGANGASVIRVDPLGHPVEAWSVGQGASCQLIGTHDGSATLSGTASFDEQGSVVTYPVLVRVAEQQGTACAMSTTGVSSADVVASAPQFGCSVDARPVSVEDLVTTTTDLDFQRIDLCGSIAGVEENTPGAVLVQVFPNPVAAGGAISVVVPDGLVIDQVQVVSADGRNTCRPPVRRNGGVISVYLPSLASGAYVLRILDRTNGPLVSARLLVF